MTKKELEEIYYINREIEMWQRELKHLQCQSLTSRAQITGMPISNTNLTSDHIGDIASNMADIEQIICRKLAELQYERKKIIGFIEKVEDSQIRQIIFLRNVSCMQWNDVANEIGGGNTENSVKQAYHRFFKSSHTCHSGV